LLHDVLKLTDLLASDQVQLFSELFIVSYELLDLIHLLVKDLKLSVGQENSGWKFFVDLIDLKKLLLEQWRLGRGGSSLFMLLGWLLRIEVDGLSKCCLLLLDADV
jgi:hypothetical protein